MGLNEETADSEIDGWLNSVNTKQVRMEPRTRYFEQEKRRSGRHIGESLQMMSSDQPRVVNFLVGRAARRMLITPWHPLITVQDPVKLCLIATTVLADVLVVIGTRTVRDSNGFSPDELANAHSRRHDQSPAY